MAREACSSSHFNLNRNLATVAWLNFSVKEGPKILYKKICPVYVTDILGDAIDFLMSEMKMSTTTVSHVEGFSKEPTASATGPQIGTELNSSMPISTVIDFGFKFIQVTVAKCNETPDEAGSAKGSSSIQKQSALDILMKHARAHESLPKKIESPSNGRQRMYNSILQIMEDFDVGFRAGQAEDLGKSVAETLTEVLWYISPYAERLAGRSFEIPECFACLTVYNDPRKQHKKIPQMTSSELRGMVNKTGNLLMLPWFMIAKFKPFRDVVSSLFDSLNSYLSYLDAQNEKVKGSHAASEPVRSVKDHWVLETFEAANSANDKYVDLYKELNLKLSNVDVYEAVSLCEFLPEDCAKRRVYVEHLKDAFPYPIHLWTYSYGNNLGNTYFLWKIPSVPAERESTADIRIMFDLGESIRTFATRAMRKEFINKYASKTSLKPSILRNMFYMLTGHDNASNTLAEKALDERVCDFLLSADDEELIFDLRANNGAVKNAAFDQFWEELEKYLEEHSVVNDRRQSKTTYLPLAMSVEDLRKKILERLPEGASAPSCSWIRLNFQPKNRYFNAALNYTGKFDVRYHVQQRILRCKHEDSGFCFNQYLLMKEMAVKWRDWAQFQCLDDKAIIPVGEPDAAVSTGVRARHGCLVVGSSAPVSLDHDFHIAGIVPSVCFEVDIPENPQDSFYNGILHVTVKDKVFEASSPRRHAAETSAIMSQLASIPPLLFRLTDGGPDHNTTFKSVQLAALCEFVVHDLDLLVLVRTAPKQSYNNPAERMMSILNLALQNVAYARTGMSDNFEWQVKSLNSISAIRNAANKNSALKNAFTESMAAPIASVKERFQALKWKDENVQVHDAASPESLKEITQKLAVIDDTVEFDSIHSAKDVARHPKLKDFMDTHCVFRQYTFQIKKCKNHSEKPCGYCTLHPPRMPDDLFQGLHVLPDPMLDVSGEFKTFAELYGTETSDAHRPSVLRKPEYTDADKKNSSLMVGGKARAFILCKECGKRRVVYANQRITLAQRHTLARLEEELLYTCGSTLVPEQGQNQNMIVRESITCSSPMETQYYADVIQCFPAVCYHCGDTEVAEDDHRIKQSKEEFAIVRPMCKACLNEGKKIITRNALKIKKKKN